MAAFCVRTSANMWHTRTLAASQPPQTSFCHHQIRRLPRSSTRRSSVATLAKRQMSSKAVPTQQQTEVVQADTSQALDNTTLNGLRALPVDQRQALLFLAMSSGVWATSDVSQASDVQSLAALSVDRGQVISFLVNNPFVTLGVAVALYIIVPRILRVVVKYILLPVSIAGVVYLIITNPSTSVGVASTGFKYITANPAITSIAILGVLALALSPYVLVIGGLVLVFSAASLPGPLKKLLPAPVVEAERQLDFVREKVKGPTAEAASKLNSFKDSILGSKPKALSRAHLDSTRLLSAPTLFIEEEKSQQQ
ncbi:hypothetical protein ABBQ32_005031 [Trebouxia sp. C0010 RCD-2024]